MKLAVATGAAVFLALAGFGVAAYRDIRADALDRARGQLRGSTQEVASILETSGAQVVSDAERQASSAALQSAMAWANSGRSGAADSVLSHLVTGSIMRAELRDSEGRVLAYAGSASAAGSRAVREFRSAQGSQAALGPIDTIAGVPVYDVSAPVGARGILFQYRALSPSARTLKQLRALIGPHVEILLGEEGGPWTDFMHVVAPPAAPQPTGGSARGDTAGGGWLSQFERVSGTPWTLVVRTPRASAIATAHTLLVRLVLLGVLALVLTVVTVVVIAGTLTRPLSALARAADELRAGNYAHRVGLRRRDEIGRVAAAFDAMADRLATVREDLDRRIAEATTSEAKYRALFDASPHPMWVFDSRTLQILAANDAMTGRYGYSQLEVSEMTIAALRPPDDVPKLFGHLDHMTDAADGPTVWRHRAKDGSEFDVEVTGRSLKFAGRDARLVLGIDLTERRRAEAAVHAVQARLQNVIASSGAVIFELRLTDGEARMEWISENVTAILGYSPQDARSDRWWSSNVHPADRPSLGNRPQSEGYHAGSTEYRFRHRNGGYRWLREERRVLLDDRGRPRAVIGAWLDITEHRKAEDALRETQDQLRYAITATGSVVYRVRLAGREIVPVWISENVSDVLGHSVSDALSPSWWLTNVHPDDFRQLAIGGTWPAATDGVREYRFRDRDGRYRWIRDEQHLVRDEAGVTREIVGIWLDVTERRELEVQLQHSQKMEAIGRLAGGVAHDFNNLLTVILAECEATAIEPESSVGGGLPAAAVDAIQDSALRAASLTRQLLTFSRRQITIPTEVNLNEVVAGVDRMLRRLIGEDVRVELCARAERATLVADAGQLEQVVMNLAVNARDAMPDGGVLRIETDRVSVRAAGAGAHPELPRGEYLVLSVADTGRGITPEVRAHLFEPFFTTKAPGKGTGLGLATTYGIVRQLGGQIAVETELGKGTTMRIYLPASDGASRSMEREVTSIRGTNRGRETILLVEDDSQVRRVAERILASCGYTVFAAVDGNEALSWLDAHDTPLDLLLTDVVLPGMGGRTLADQARARRPGLRVLFTSGYADDAVLRTIAPTSGVAMLQKPFTKESLSRTVRECLDHAGVAEARQAAS